MLRLIIAMLLLSASAHVLALNNRAENVIPACQATESMGRDEPVQAVGALHSRAIRPVRGNKAAKPALNPGNGGGNDDDSQPRLRGSKWHSFLPGMFR